MLPGVQPHPPGPKAGHGHGHGATDVPKRSCLETSIGLKSIDSSRSPGWNRSRSLFSMAKIAEIEPSLALKSANLGLVDAAAPGERCRLPGLGCAEGR